MLELSSAAGLVVQGLRSNLFGLACPFYCASPGIGALLACFLSGLLCGFGLGAWLIFRFDLFPVVSSTSAPPGSSHLSGPSRPEGVARSALRKYLYEQPRRRY